MLLVMNLQISCSNVTHMNHGQNPNCLHFRTQKSEESIKNHHILAEAAPVCNFQSTAFRPFHEQR